MSEDLPDLIHGALLRSTRLIGDLCGFLDKLIEVSDAQVVEQEGLHRLRELVRVYFLEGLVEHGLSLGELGALEGEGGGHGEIKVTQVLGGEAVLEVREQVVAIVTCLVHVVF